MCKGPERCDGYGSIWSTVRGPVLPRKGTDFVPCAGQILCDGLSFNLSDSAGRKGHCSMRGH